MSGARAKSTRAARSGGRAPAPKLRTARAIIVGNEILTGKIQDKNLGVLARTLRRLGVLLTGASTVPDQLGVIAREVRSASRTHDWVFTSGGVGPTHDDVTIDAVARAFAQPVVRSRALEGLIRRAYGDSLREGHLWMARVPKGAKLVASPEIPWPVVMMRNVWVLPGVPEIFEIKMRLVAERIGQHGPYHSVAVLTRLDEGNLKPLIDRVVSDYPDVEVGSYPRWTDPDVRTKLTFDARDLVRCVAARDALVATLPVAAVAGLEG